ncbi:MAG: M1 family metallopeptidase [Limnohabitans sp.]|nr:M1 family metallopeptidase [Limnohabitans sp.]
MRILFLLFTLVALGQQTKKVDFIKLDALVKPEFETKSVSGNCTYQFKVISPIDTIRIDAVKMDFEDVKINGKLVNYKNSNKALLLFEGFKKGNNILTFHYSAMPKQTMYFVGTSDIYQIWTQGQGKYTSHWLPSFDDVNEKLIFNISAEYRNDYQIISNGNLVNKSYNSKGSHITWQYQMEKQMSSYLVMLAIGNYKTYKLKSDSGVPIDLYLKPDDAAKYESTYKYSKEIFDFLENQIGVKYPWSIYKQVPVDDFLYAGMENTSATLFSQDFVVDEIGFNDRNYVNVNAHELAHQWFGDLVTAKEGKHHWLQEGFATFYALLAERKVFGEEYFQFELLKYAEEIQSASKRDTIPILNEKASSLSFYKKGAWALYDLRTSVGAQNFDKAVKNYLKKHQFKNVTTDDFLTEIKKVSPRFDTQQFQKEWLESKTFPITKALQLLSKNASVKQLFEVQKLAEIPFEQKKAAFIQLIQTDVYYPIKQEIIWQTEKVSFEDKKELLEAALKTNDVKVRQIVAQTVTKFPVEFKSQYESLLNDKSYNTKENVLQNLCNLFPENSYDYLNQTKDIQGMNDKSFRTVWLGLAYKNNSFDASQKEQFYKELLDYAQPTYDSSIRKNALEVLLQINSQDAPVLKALVNAVTHHKWQFVAFAKNTIRGMLKKENYKKAFQELLPSMSEKEQHFLKGEMK